MRPYILAESSYKSVKNTGLNLAILPWGATEAHNLHLPYGTDCIEGEIIAAESARIAWEAGAKVIVLPIIPFGVNTGQKDIPLDINMNPTTQLAVLGDIIEVLNHQKIHKLMILNSHGGNDFKLLIREMGYEYPEMYISLCNFYQILDLPSYFEEPGEHAGEMETSLLLHLVPELVLPIEEAGSGLEKKHKISAFREGWAWSERKWSQVTGDTGIGNPKQATKEKGQKYFTDLTKKIGALMIDLAKIDKDNLYG